MHLLRELRGIDEDPCSPLDDQRQQRVYHTGLLVQLYQQFKVHLADGHRRHSLREQLTADHRDRLSAQSNAIAVQLDPEQAAPL